MRGSWNWAIAADAARDFGPGMEVETIFGPVGSSGKKEDEACVARERRESAERSASREAISLHFAQLGTTHKGNRFRLLTLVEPPRATTRHATMEEITHLEQYRTLSSAVEQLAKEIVTKRMQSLPLDSTSHLASAAPLFASLHAVNRKSSAWAMNAKGTSAEARKAMDHAHLLLQNLLFERNHLEKEISNCERFE